MRSMLNQTIDVLIHIGAGRGDDLPDYLSGKIKRIVLIEPNPEFAQKLSTEALEHPRVEVWELAVASSRGKGSLNVFNWPEASSLTQPTALTELFPGLNIECMYQIQTITVEDTFRRLKLEGNESVHVAIEARGLETLIVDELLAQPEIQQVAGITLTCGKDSFYEGAKPASELIEKLCLYGYEVAKVEEKDPDFPTWELRRNVLKDRLDRVTKQLKKKTEALEVSEQKLAEEHKQAIESAERIGNLEKELAVVNEEAARANNEFKNLETRHSHQLEQLHAQLQEEEQRSAQLRGGHAQQLETLQAQHQQETDSFESESAHTAKRLLKSEQNVEAVKKRLHLTQNENEALQKRLIAFQSELSKAEAQIDLIKDLMIRESL